MKNFVISNTLRSSFQNVTYFEFTLLGDPVLHLLPKPPKKTEIDYKKPYIWINNTLPSFFERSQSGKIVFDLKDNETMMIVTSNSSTTLTFKLIKLVFRETVARERSEEGVYTFAPDTSTYYNIRAISPDGKEGWLSFGVRLPVISHPAILCNSSPCVVTPEMLGSKNDCIIFSEPNQPNTIDGCRDGIFCTHSKLILKKPQSVESITVKDLNGSVFRPGDTILINASVLFADYSGSQITPIGPVSYTHLTLPTTERV